MACALLRGRVQLFVVGRVQLLIANSQVTRPETRTFGYYALELFSSGAFLNRHLDQRALERPSSNDVSFGQMCLS